MTEEQRTPLDSALDLFVYAPVGLALTAAEELPKLAEKGRAQVKGQIAIARVVGQFALAQGRRQIEKRLGADGRPGGVSAGTGPAGSEVRQPSGTPGFGGAGGHGTNGAAPDHSDPIYASEPDGGYERLAGRQEQAEDERSDATALGSAGTRSDPAPAPQLATSAGRGPSSGDLAIPGYDSLSASQVVQRLAGLSKDELEAVGAYESAHRARRTILTRVNQLKA